MSQPYKPSATVWTLIALMLVSNLLVLSGIVSGLIPDVIRLVLSLSVAIAVGHGWWKTRQG